MKIIEAIRAWWADRPPPEPVLPAIREVFVLPLSVRADDYGATIYDGTLRPIGHFSPPYSDCAYKGQTLGDAERQAEAVMRLVNDAAQREDAEERYRFALMHPLGG